MSTWYKRNPTRLVLERQAMKKKFSQFELGKHFKGYLQWQGIVKREDGRSYEIMILYPNNFPAEPPRVTIVGIDFYLPYGFDLHRGESGGLCLFTKGYKPGVITARALLERTIEWIENFEEYERSGKWQGKVNIAHKISSHSS